MNLDTTLKIAGLVVTLLTIAATFVGGFAVLRYKVAQDEKAREEHKADVAERFDRFEDTLGIIAKEARTGLDLAREASGVAVEGRNKADAALRRVDELRESTSKTATELAELRGRVTGELDMRRLRALKSTQEFPVPGEGA